MLTVDVNTTVEIEQSQQVTQQPPDLQLVAAVSRFKAAKQRLATLKKMPMPISAAAVCAALMTSNSNIDHIYRGCIDTDVLIRQDCISAFRQYLTILQAQLDRDEAWHTMQKIISA